MASRYTDEQKRDLNRYRSSRSYYNKKLAMQNAAMVSLREAMYWDNYNNGNMITLKDIRKDLTYDEAYICNQAGLFADDDYYKFMDFRDAMIDVGLESLADRISRRLGYGSLDDYTISNEARLQSNEEYQRLNTAIENTEDKIEALNDAIDSIRFGA